MWSYEFWSWFPWSVCRAVYVYLRRDAPRSYFLVPPKGFAYCRAAASLLFLSSGNEEGWRVEISEALHPKGHQREHVWEQACRENSQVRPQRRQLGARPSLSSEENIASPEAPWRKPISSWLFVGRNTHQVSKAKEHFMGSSCPDHQESASLLVTYMLPL